MLSKIRVNQDSLIHHEEKCILVKKFLFHSTCQVRDGNFLKMCVSEICVKRIRVNQGLGVLQIAEINPILFHKRAHQRTFLEGLWQP